VGTTADATNPFEDCIVTSPLHLASFTLKLLYSDAQCEFTQIPQRWSGTHARAPRCFGLSDRTPIVSVKLKASQLPSASLSGARGAPQQGQRPPWKVASQGQIPLQ